MLAELMRIKYGIAIAGSHGKTTTTSMVAQVLSGAGLDPTIIVGGRLGVLGSGAKLGRGDLLVAEADESDGSFLRLTPTIAVVTNIDAEHLDHYGTVDALQEAFVDFLNRVPFYGVGIVCLDDTRIRQILPRLSRRVVTYGFSAQADLSAARVELKEFHAAFDVHLRGCTASPTPSRRSPSASISRSRSPASPPSWDASAAPTAASSSRGRRRASW
jgi:UDP-N-acetylmuramate--alanine ligase